MEAFFTLVLLFFSQLFGTWVGVPDPQKSIPETAQTKESEEIAQVTAVVDGDTIKVLLNGKEEKVRYIGVDTPEPYRDKNPACFSKEATARNTELVAGKEVRLVPDTENRDRYNRLLRYVYVDDVFVNEQLVREGYATTLTIKPNTQFADLFASAEGEARNAGVGLWSVCKNQPDTQAASEHADETVIESSQLTAGQQRLLKVLGINTDTFVVTADMIACAKKAVGSNRLAEITAGTAPSIAEGLKLISCYRP
jgi:micrococcal nuclease